MARRDSRDGNTLLGLALGLVIGGGLALIFTPYSGKRLREKLLAGVERARSEVRGTERYGGGPEADPISVLKRRFEEAMIEARRAYDQRRAELLLELERDRNLSINRGTKTGQV